jgi:peptidyl-prolyl cis-trans isomerase SurA
MADDYQILQDKVLLEKRAEVLEKWIREKQRITYVKINEGWNDCEFKYPGWGQH